MFQLKLYFLVILFVFTYGKKYDLTWTIDEKFVVWPGFETFRFTRNITSSPNEDYYWLAREFATAEHGGTHLDAPLHFYTEGWSVSDIPLERLIASGITIDLTKETLINGTETLLLPKHLQNWVKSNGPLPNNCVVLIRFGWGRFYGNRTKYLGIDEDNKLNFPGISEDAANWLVNTGKVVGVGLDTASMDPGSSEEFPVHQIFCKNKIYNLENVNIPADLPSKDFTLYVMPMKMKAATGAPVRLLAVC